MLELGLRVCCGGVDLQLDATATDAQLFTREKVQRSTRGASAEFAPSSEAVASPVNSERSRLFPMPGSPAISTTSVWPRRDD